jgi:hypothetical protein
MANQLPPLPEGATFEAPPLPRGATQNPLSLPPGATETIPKQESEGKGPIERASQFGKSVLGGTAFSAALPEITTGVGKALGYTPYPPARALGLGLQAAGRGMRGMRGKLAYEGAIGGGVGDIAGQATELAGGGPGSVLAAEIAGGIAGPAFSNTITKAVQYGSRKLLGLDSNAAVSAIAKDIGVDEKTLSPKQRELIKAEIDKLRGGAPSTRSQEQLYDILRGGASGITEQASQAADIERIMGVVQRTAAERQAEKMRLAGKRSVAAGEAELEAARVARSSVGPEREASEIGTELRDKIMRNYGSQAEQRSAQYNKQKQVRDEIVAQKESAGQLVKELPEYKELVSDLRNKLLIGEKAQRQTTAPVTEKGVLQAYQNIYDAVTDRRVQVGVNELGNPVYKTFPTSFDALDDVRRRLGDVAFGKEVEGYAAIGSDIARKYYGKISDIQSKYAGEAHDLLQSQYEAASRLLEKYKSKPGAKATAIDRFDPTRFKTDPSSLPKDYFRSSQSVKDIIELTQDKALVDRAAASFASRELKNLSAKQASEWATKNNDWLKELPELKQRVADYVKTVERAERIGKQTTEAQRILASREPTVLKAGERAVSEAEKRAGKITEEASKRVETILGDKNPAARVREIILSGRPSIWKEVGPILSGSQQGRAVIGDAVNQIMADRAAAGVVGAVRAFREDVAPSLKASGLMTDRQLASVAQQLDTIANTASPEPFKLTLMQRVVKNAVSSLAATPTGGAITTIGGALMPSNFLQSQSEVTNMQPRSQR